MRVIATRIPPGSHELAIWPELAPGYIDEGQPIGVVCNIIRMTQYECIVTHAKGDLSDEVNVAIGLEAIRLGYKVMHFAVSKGTVPSRRARFEKNAGLIDWYKVDLLAEARNLSIQSEERP